MSDVTAGMSAGHRRRFVGQYVMLLLALLVVVASFGMLFPEGFFVGALAGYLLLVEFTASSYLQPRWRGLLRWPAGVGYVVFVLLAVRYFVTVVREGLG